MDYHETWVAINRACFLNIKLICTGFPLPGFNFYGAGKGCIEKRIT